MKRKDCFFGLHFDYHANKDTQDIGKYFDPELLDKIIREVKPDFIQCDTKGHPGYASYFTKVGTPAPGLSMDLLKAWREISAKHGVLLYSHYSGVWDMKAAKDHPEWTITFKDGSKSDKLSPFSPYADQLLIPQLNELARLYHMDGAWVDGECWADAADYNEQVVKDFIKKYGFDPKGELSHEQQLTFEKYNREAFFQYVKHYIDEVKKENPNFEITSNWLNSALVPDALDITDYISGDLSPTNSVDSARFDARVMAAYHRNFDILSWAISFPIHYAKSSVQLCQEAAIVMSQGGGYQIYNMQSPLKVVMDPWAIPFWKGVSEFVHRYKPYCINSKPVHDVGFIYSVDAHYETVKALFQRDCEYDFELYGLLLSILDNGRSVNIINSQLIEKEDLSSYSCLVISNGSKLEKIVKEKVLEYVASGGELLLEGVDSIDLFKEDLKLDYPILNHDNQVAILNGKDYSVEIRKPYLPLKGKFAHATFMNECDVYGDITCFNPPPSISPRLENVPSSFVLNYQKGKIHIIPINIGKTYLDDRTFELRYFMRDVLSSFQNRRLSSNKNGEVELSVRNKENKTYIHIVNLLGEHRSQTVKTFDHIPALKNVTVHYACSKPSHVILQPENKELKTNYKNGVLTIHLKEVKLYSIIEIKA